MSGHHHNCGHGTNWTCPCTCDEIYIAESNRKSPQAKVEAAPKIERLMLYVSHWASCRASELDPLDDTPCTCGLRAVLSPGGRP